MKIVNTLITVIALILVDRKGRKFLLMLGSGGIVLALLSMAVLFVRTERDQTDVRQMLTQKIEIDQLTLRLDTSLWRKFGVTDVTQSQQLTVAYSYGGFSNVRSFRSDDLGATEFLIRREDTVKADSVIGRFFRRMHLNPFPDPADAAMAPLVIERASLGKTPSLAHGWMVAVSIFLFVAFFAVGPGVCVWLALSELMPTRIRSNGMSLALLINQFVSTSIAAAFLPAVGRYGYASMFLFWSGCTVIYFLVATFLLPETKGKTLEQIEAHFH